MKVLILLVGLAVSPSLAQDCWWTGCQPNNWAVTGCGQYGRVEQSRSSCPGGNKYNCCAGGAAAGAAGGASANFQANVNAGVSFPTGAAGAQTDLTYEQFAKAVTSAGYPRPSQETFKNFKNNAAKVGKISTKQEQAMALAQFLWESDGLRATKEYACKDTGCPGQYRVPGCDAPGQDYYGRGYIQLTWCYNYKKASQDIFGDDRLVKNPELVATDDDTAWKTAFWYWANAVHDAPGVQQGQFGATTKAINGALECSWAGNPKPQKRFDIYSKVRAAFELPGPGISAGCA